MAIFAQNSSECHFFLENPSFLYRNYLDNEIDILMETKRFEAENSSSDEEDQEFKRMLRKTIQSRRKTIIEENKRQSQTSENSEVNKPKAGFGRFKAAAKTIAITQQFIASAAAETFAEQEDPMQSTSISKSSEKTESNNKLDDDTVEFEPYINPRILHKRRDGLHADKFTENSLRDQLASMKADDHNAWVIHPYSKFRFYWDIATVFIILSNVISIPLEFSFFDGKTELNNIKMFTDVWFTLDMMLTFRTGFINSNTNTRKNVNMNPRDIRRSYLRSWFIVDLLATFPFDMVFQQVAGWVQKDGVAMDVDQFSAYMKVSRIFKILKLSRLFRFGRLVRYLHHWEEILSMDYGSGENVIKGIVWLVGMAFICHWNACILYLVPTESTTGIPPNGTLYAPKDSYSYSWYYNEGFHHVDSKTLTQRYFWCLFKSMSHMLTIGYGVNTPHVMSDVWTSIFVMFGKYCGESHKVIVEKSSEIRCIYGKSA